MQLVLAISYRRERRPGTLDGCPSARFRVVEALVSTSSGIEEDAAGVWCGFESSVMLSARGPREVPLEVRGLTPQTTSV